MKISSTRPLLGLVHPRRQGGRRRVLSAAEDVVVVVAAAARLDLVDPGADRRSGS